jgi:hypothetical protein
MILVVPNCVCVCMRVWHVAHSKKSVIIYAQICMCATVCVLYIDMCTYVHTCIYARVCVCNTYTNTRYRAFAVNVSSLNSPYIFEHFMSIYRHRGMCILERERMCVCVCVCVKSICA